VVQIAGRVAKDPAGFSAFLSARSQKPAKPDVSVLA
jgi:hypothetical protein